MAFAKSVLPDLLLPGMKAEIAIACKAGLSDGGRG